MKRIPIALALLTAGFLLVCHLEYGFRGLNPDVESDWVSHPAWWQSEALADGGFFLMFLSIYESAPFSHWLGDNERSVPIFFFVSQLLTIAVMSFVVFHVAKLLTRLPWQGKGRPASG